MTRRTLSVRSAISRVLPLLRCARWPLTSADSFPNRGKFLTRAFVRPLLKGSRFASSQNTGSITRWRRGQMGDQCPEVVPMISYEDGVAALTWLAQAFGFRERMRILAPDGSLVH